MMTKTAVWTISIRFFHWLLALGFVVTYVLSDFKELSNFHYAFGLFVGTLIFFRIIFGFIGSRYAHFKDFPLSILSFKIFINNIKTRKQNFIGHNPAASLVMLSIFVVGILSSFSGYALYATENGVRFFSNFNEDFLEELHEIVVHLFLVLVVFHLLGIFVDTVLHPQNKTLLSIFNGYKMIDGEDSKPNNFQKAFSIFWFIVPFLMFFYGMNLSDSEHKKSAGNETIEHLERNENED